MAASVLCMADGDREGVGGIRAQSSLERQERLDHVQDLCFLCCACPGDGLFDSSRCIFENRCSCVCGPAECGTPRLAEFQGAIRIAVHEHSLDGDLSRRVGRDELRHVAMDFEQPSCHGAIPDTYATARDVADTTLADIHDAIAGDSRTGIEAEDAHHGSYDSHSP